MGGIRYGETRAQMETLREMGTQRWKTEIRTRWWEHIMEDGGQKSLKTNNREGKKDGVLKRRIWEDGTKAVIGGPHEKHGDLSQT